MYSNKDIIRYYDECNPEYSLWYNKENLSIHYGYWDSNTKKHSDSLLNMNKILAEKIKIKKGDIILDAGCGVGGSSIWLAKNFKVRVIGITLSKKQVCLANKYAKEQEVDHLVKFYVMDYLNTKFKSNYFDAIFGLECVCYAKNKKEFISEAKRTLKKGGRLVIMDGFYNKKLFSKKEKEILQKWLSGWLVPNLAEKDEFKKYLKELKFKNITFSDITKNIMPSSIRIYKLSIMGIVIWKILELLKFKSKIQLGHIKSGIYQFKALKRKLWVYGIFCCEK